MSGDNVVQLVDYAPISVDGQEGMARWLQAWAEAIGRGDEGDIDTIAIVFERADGSFGKVSQSLRHLDTNTLVGFLHRACLAIHLGDASLRSA